MVSVAPANSMQRNFNSFEKSPSAEASTSSAGGLIATNNAVGTGFI
jgi:hypothetical protein